MNAGLILVVRRRIEADAARLFHAWTDPAQLLAWWGPRPVRCCSAEVDLRIGGGYRIGNKLPDGKILWISGRFETVEPPHLLIYSWQVEGSGMGEERVSVRFMPQGDVTEVIVTHERIGDATLRERHAQGWEGCFDGLQQYLATQ